MTFTTHVAIGATIGSLIGNPLLGFLLGLISHFLVDMIPHGDNNLADRYRANKKKRMGVAYVTVDAACAILLLMSIVSGRPNGTDNIAFSAAVVGSILPDLLVGLKELFSKSKILKGFYRVHFFFHDFFSRKYGDVKLSHAIAGQAIFIVVLMHYFVT